MRIGFISQPAVVVLSRETKISFITHYPGTCVAATACHFDAPGRPVPGARGHQGPEDTWAPRSHSSNSSFRLSRPRLASSAKGTDNMILTQPGSKPRPAQEPPTRPGQRPVEDPPERGPVVPETPDSPPAREPPTRPGTWRGMALPSSPMPASSPLKHREHPSGASKAWLKIKNPTARGVLRFQHSN